MKPDYRSADAVIDVVCVTDENYTPHFAALLKSIEQNKGPERVRVHAVLDGVQTATFDKIAKSVPGLSLIAYQVTEHKALSLPPLLQISRATYLRLIIEELIDPTYARLLYLDIDMVVTCSLLELWNINLQGFPCAAAVDPGVRAESFSERFRLPGIGRYLNAGTLLIDMARVREQGQFRQALDHLLSGELAFEFADQDALNLVLWKSWLELDPSWNFQRKFLYHDYDYASASSELPKIIHFTESAKPWSDAEWHPHAWLYWKYLRMTPFHTDVASQGGIGPLRLLKFWLKFHLKGRAAA